MGRKRQAAKRNLHLHELASLPGPDILTKGWRPCRQPRIQPYASFRITVLNQQIVEPILRPFGGEKVSHFH